MAEGPSFDPANVVATSIVIVVMVALAIKLIPILAEVAWQVFPSIVVLLLIYGCLRGILSKLFD